METYRSNKINYASIQIVVGLIFLIMALVFGLLAALQYVFPGIARNTFSFDKLRPLHVSSAVFWILSAAIGAILSYLDEDDKTSKKTSSNVVKYQFYLFTITFIAIIISYFFGIFGGREYWEFHPYFAIPIILGWLLFLLKYCKAIGTLKNQPVYVWMWLTGIVFFIFTYIESNLWLIPGIKKHLVKDMLIQWKSYGSMVGAWNMLIYGSSVFLMDKIAGNKKYSFSKIAFLLYFLSLFNLMFNWGHHIYTLPTQQYVRYISYSVSMTEFFILGRIIYNWRLSLREAQKNFHYRPYQFLVAADVWIFLNLALALAMSIPVINVYLHGTFAVIAHAMGTTIGINSLLLIAFAFDITATSNIHFNKYEKTISLGYNLMNISLAVFWLILIITGILKAHWQFTQPEVPFTVMMHRIRPWFYIFYISGLILVVSFIMIIYPLIKNGFLYYFRSQQSIKTTPTI